MAHYRIKLKEVKYGFDYLLETGVYYQKWYAWVVLNILYAQAWDDYKNNVNDVDLVMEITETNDRVTSRTELPVCFAIVAILFFVFIYLITKL